MEQDTNAVAELVIDGKVMWQWKSGKVERWKGGKVRGEWEFCDFSCHIWFRRNA
jgi:hypothetical protein